ncbi:MAG TPA: hypothetical protein DC047_02715 [Blastocatellia bacterium]|nr:hypothetical protein [Blastocatellia bacterium]
MSGSAFPGRAIALLPGFAPTGARSFLGCVACYKHLAPLERKPISLLHLEVESTHLPFLLA